MSETFGKERRLTRRIEFQRVYSDGDFYRTPWFVCHILRTSDRSRPARLGITASKRTGRAHNRNRYKRWAREVIRREALRGGIEIVVTFRPAIASVEFEQFRSALVGILGRAGLFEE